MSEDTAHARYGRQRSACRAALHRHSRKARVRRLADASGGRELLFFCLPMLHAPAASFSVSRGSRKQSAQLWYDLRSPGLLIPPGLSISSPRLAILLEWCQHLRKRLSATVIRSSLFEGSQASLKLRAGGTLDSVCFALSIRERIDPFKLPMYQGHRLTISLFSSPILPRTDIQQALCLRMLKYLGRLW